MRRSTRFINKIVISRYICKEYEIFFPKKNSNKNNNKALH